jgi:Xaa-Pro aminopeptidase
MAQEQIAREKHRLIPGLLEDTGAEAWLVLAREDSDLTLPYILNGHLVMDSAFLFTRQGSTAFLGHIDTTNRRGDLFDSVVEYTPAKLESALGPVLKRLDPKVLALNYSATDHTADGLSHGLYRRLELALGRRWLLARMVSAEDIVADLRGIKTEAELGLLRRAAELTAAAAARLWTVLRPGVTHAELRELFTQAVAATGPATVEFMIPTSGRPGEILRGRPDFAVRPGDALILDLGVRYQGYTSDYKRMWYFLRPGEDGPPADLRRGFEVCRDIISRAAEQLRAGRPGHEVDGLARRWLREAGYEEFKHSFGHQVGRAVHDGGTALGPPGRPRSARTVRPNMVFTLDPTIKMVDHYPVGLEEQAWVQPEGPARFFVPPQAELWLVQP